MADIGYATLSVIPSAKGFGADLSRQVNPQMTSAGAVGGQAFGGGMLSAAKKFAAPLAGLFVATAVVDFFKDAAQAAIEDEKSVVALATAMDNLGMSTQNADAEKFISDMQRSTGVADDELRPALQKLLTATGDLTQSQKLLSLAQDISAGTGRDLASVSQGLARASMGQFSALQRLGIPLDADIIKSKDFAAATDVLSQKFGGQAAAAADTYGGRLKILSTTADEAKETIGYALLDAVDAFSGGLDGQFADSLTTAGDNVANFIRGLTVGGQALRDFSNPPAGTETSGVIGFLQDVNDRVSSILERVPGSPQFILDRATNLAAGITSVGEASTRSAEASASAEYASARQAITYGAAGRAARSAAGDVDLFTEGLKEYLGLISESQAQIQFRQHLAELDTALKGNARTFVGRTDAVRENQSALLSLLAEDAQNVDTWAERTGASAEERNARLAEGQRRVMKNFRENGYKQADMEAFLGSQGIWTEPMKRRLAATATAVAAAAVAAGTEIGSDLARGVPLGLKAQTPAVQAAGMRLIAMAEAAMRDAAESQSPSKLTFRVGEDLGAGLAGGVRSKTGDIAAAGTAAIRDAVKVMMAAARESRDQAMAAIRGVSDSVVGGVLGNINFSTMTTDAEGKAVPLTPAQMVAMILGDVKNQTDAVTAIAANVGAKLPPALLSQIATMPPETAIALAKYLGENPALLGQLTTSYTALGTFTTTALGVPMGLAWAEVGDKSAKEMLAAARELVKARKDTFSAWVSEQLSTTITVGVRFVSSGTDFPGRANGGPVLAGQPYTVGERGEETFVPGVNGTILPHGSLDMASASQRRDAVAGVGDVSMLVEEIRGLRKDVRDQAEKDRTLVRSNGYGR